MTCGRLLLTLLLLGVRRRMIHSLALVALAGLFRFNDGSLLTYKLVDGNECANRTRFSAPRRAPLADYGRNGPICGRASGNADLYLGARPS
jgi:hypothetical protein